VTCLVAIYRRRRESELASSGRSRQSGWLLYSRIAELAAGPCQILIQGYVFLAEFTRPELAQRLGELAFCVVDRVLSGPPYVVPQLAVLPEPPELREKGLSLHADPSCKSSRSLSDPRADTRL
jgi:hypothetical protein